MNLQRPLSGTNIKIQIFFLPILLLQILTRFGHSTVRANLTLMSEADMEAGKGLKVINFLSSNIKVVSKSFSKIHVNNFLPCNCSLFSQLHSF